MADLIPIDDAPSWTSGSRARDLISGAQADAALATELARLRVVLKAIGRAMKVMDAWIAATAMAVGAAVCTQDGDFDVVEESGLLEVVWV